MTKAKKNRHLFWSMDMGLKLTQCINFMDVIGMLKESYKKTTKEI